jgi:hypothetical protein
MDHLVKTLIRFWLATTSILAFLFGWILFAHAEKPAPLTTQPAQASQVVIPTLAPIPSLEQLQQSPQILLNSSNIPSITANSFPIMRTRGS